MPNHTTLRAQLISQTDSRFEILFLQADEANGYSFPADVLKQSVPLWEECSVFVDHSPWGRSVRDLGGVLSNVGFSREYNGLTATLTPCGPSAEIVLEAARLMLGNLPHPDLGFSADLIFTADAHANVQKIMQPISVDLVVDPAFATRFIRQLNSRGIVPASDPAGVYGAAGPRTGSAGDTTKFIRQLNSKGSPMPKMHLQRTSDIRLSRSTPVGQTSEVPLQIETLRELLNAKLRNAELPAPAEAELRARFDGRIFQPEELNLAVNTWKSALAEIEVPDEIEGPRRISAMFDSRDHVQAAIDDLVGAPREPGAESLRVAAFSGIKDAYLHLTGDRDFVGGYFPDRVQFQHTSLSFPGLLANSLNKALAREWSQLGRAGYDWWQKIVTVEHFNTLNDITWMLFGTVGSLPTVSEGAEYTELKIGDSAETSSFVKKGGYIGLTLEALDKDDTRKLRAIPRELANAGLREISALVAALFTSNSGVGPTMSDTGALFNSTAVTTRGGHANLLTTALGTDFTAWDAVSTAMFDQPMLVASELGYYGTGKKVAVEPRYRLVPRALRAQAEALFIPRWASTVDASIAAKGGPSYGGYVQPIVVPEWTDATDWAAVADPAVMPGIMLGERFGLLPQVFVAGSETDPAMFANDETRIKVRHFIAVGVADFRPLHKENVGG